MKIKNLLILGLVLLGFTYCSSDDVIDGSKPGSGETADNLKMEIAIKMPTGANTRTTSPATDVEAGTTEENQPNSVLIVLVDKTSQKVVGTYNSDATDKTNTVGATFFTTAQFKVSDLVTGNKFDVYAFVNPYDELLGNYPIAKDEEKFNTEAAFGADKAANVKALIEAVTGPVRNNFFMSNADEVQTVTVEATHIQGAPLKVGINVQRAVARMDYVDKEGENPKRYTIQNSATKKNGDSEDLNVSVTFENFKPMNVSKSFFNLKRVADGAGAGLVIGGAETAENYVVDTDWDAKAGDASGWGDLFHSTLKTAETDAAVKANYVSMAKTGDKLGQFYVTENTLPLAQNNKKGVATAVVFKGYLNFDASYIKSGDVSGMVYVWNNKFYGSFANLPAGIQAISEKTDTEKAVDYDVDAYNKRVVKDLASAGVTGYSKDTDGTFPIYYVYYNRHNDNGDPAETGAMEFAVVRNNVYKLTINGLSRFGHPNDPELVYTPGISNPDPNPEKPEDPIESADLYMQVTATVLDWTVRTNEIKF